MQIHLSNTSRMYIMSIINYIVPLKMVVRSKIYFQLLIQGEKSEYVTESHCLVKDGILKTIKLLRRIIAEFVRLGKVYILTRKGIIEFLRKSGTVSKNYEQMDFFSKN